MRQPTTPSRALLGSGLFVGLATFAANGLNALFQIALARVLSPAEYSVLVALIVITLIAAVPPLAFQASVAREVALELDGGRRNRAGAALRDTVRGLVPWALGVLLLGGVVSAVMALAGSGNAAATFATTATIAFALVIPAVWAACSEHASFSSSGSPSSRSPAPGSPRAWGSASPAATRLR